MKNRIFFCTSILQVINTKAAIIKLKKMNGIQYNDYILIIHPLLTKKNKEMIYKLANKLSYAGVFDFTSLSVNEYEKLNHNIKKNIFSRNIVNYFRNTFKLYYSLQNKIDTFLKKKIGKIDAVFYRGLYSSNKIGSPLDGFYIKAIKDVKNYYEIEDGAGNYIDFSTWYSDWHQIKHLCKLSIFLFIQTILSFIINLNFSKSYNMYFNTSVNNTLIFRNIRYKNAIVIKNEFFEAINLLKLKKIYNKKIKIIIFGTILNTTFKFNIHDEILIYENLFEQLVKKYNVNLKEIFYRPHPRCDKKSFNIYKKKLKCSIFDLNKSDLAEFEFFNKNLLCVVSIGSTALLYAKQLFNVDSYIIDVKHMKFHPKVSKVSYKTFLKYGIKKIN